MAIMEMIYPCHIAYPTLAATAANGDWSFSSTDVGNTVIKTKYAW